MTDTSQGVFCLPQPRQGESEFEEDMGLRLGFHLKLAEQAMMSAKADGLRPLGLTVAQYAVLMALHYVPGQSSAQLARTIAVTPQTMGTMLDKLASRGLIERQPSKVHRRVLETSLTEDGEALVLRADEVARSVEERLGQAFTSRERETLQELLHRAISTLHDRAPQDQALHESE
ncbi:MarR family transcriptional regulator [Rothia nasimurium]|uniref:MarR family transcriptional regulator n=1 Tax=Rothia nasimurium TaxID=85336 RepID=A0A1Y1RRD0_9MICC|nr:MarR family transcriptional regulator [Rothia nasimurium]ORC20649.1 MarR family transcriptional regulator [Rothia nasimurium]